MRFLHSASLFASLLLHRLSIRGNQIVERQPLFVCSAPSEHADVFQELFVNEALREASSYRWLALRATRPYRLLWRYQMITK